MRGGSNDQARFAAFDYLISDKQTETMWPHDYTTRLEAAISPGRGDASYRHSLARFACAGGHGPAVVCEGSHGVTGSDSSYKK